MPWLNQLVVMRSQMPEPKSRSPSLDVMLRTHDRRVLRARISAQIIPIGVRDMVLPPMPTVSPSLTNALASSRDMTLRRSLRSRLASRERISAYDGTNPGDGYRSALGDVTSRGMAHLVVEFVDEAIP